MEPKVGVLVGRYTDEEWSTFSAEDKGLLSMNQQEVSALYTQAITKNEAGQDVPILVPNALGKRREDLIDRPRIKPEGSPPPSYRPATAREAYDLNTVGGLRGSIKQTEAEIERMKMTAEDLKEALAQKEAKVAPLAAQVIKGRWFVKILGLLALAFLLPACGTFGASCKRNADGSVECGIEIHADGNHNKPVIGEK